MTRPWDREADRDRRRLLGLAAVVAAYVVAVGPVAGLPAGLATAAVASGLGTPYAVAVGHVLLLPIFPEAAHALALVTVEAGFLALLVAEGVATPAPRRFASVAVVAAVGLGALAWALATTQPLAVAAAVLAIAFGAGAYGLHRYGLLATGGLATETTETADTTPKP